LASENTENGIPLVSMKRSLLQLSTSVGFSRILVILQYLC
jgi:hypothetical protein